MIWEDLPVLGHIGQALARHHIGRPAGHLVAAEADMAPFGRGHAGDRLHRRALAGAVAAQQRHCLAALQLQANTEQDLASAVENVDAFDRQHRLRHGFRFASLMASDSLRSWP